ncbi:S8 family serine peptidase [Pirellulimonas nuda]|uniref:S8 family serine peptidase n=1 Tax=Pirellulimonas nuda TaxID=2528009 RepID=UPI001E3335CD|nr:S8 family serine peptidase [Pirellulimonas nuda]
MPAGANLGWSPLVGVGGSVRVGLLDTLPYGILPQNNLGVRLIEQVSFLDLAPADQPAAMPEGFDPHETLAADVIAGASATHPGIASGASIHLASINDSPSLRAGAAWLANHAQADVWNFSFGFGENQNGQSSDELFIDWIATASGALVVQSAGNNGQTVNRIANPGGFFNGITVGAMDELTQGRSTYSSYRLNGCAECRAKPDILAPGNFVTDGLTQSQTGTSFAAPHVAGTAAVLLEIADSQLGADPARLFARATILNSARKRGVGGPAPGLSQSFDFGANNATNDRNYLVAGDQALQTGAAGLTGSWTPTEWSVAAGVFTTTRPLDEEQGVGLLDTQRSVIQTVAGRQGPGSVAAIGWDLGSQCDCGAGALSYTLGSAAAQGAFLTATLVWDRVVMEADGDGVIESSDSYTAAPLEHLSLLVRDGLGQVVAQSLSIDDNLQHLHVPLALAASGDYSIEVAGATTPTPFGLAWWLSDAGLLPGDFDRDGSVTLQDLAVWRSGFGATSIARGGITPGDANGDLAIDAADYSLWRDHLGQSIFPAATAGVAAPEPTGLALGVLLALAAAAGAGRLRPTRHVGFAQFHSPTAADSNG